MASSKNNNNSMATPLDRLCFQVKDILRNYGKQQTAEGTMTAEVITDHLMFMKFFEAYSKDLHGDRSLKIYDKMVEKDPSIASMTLKSFMAPYIEQKRNGKKAFSEEEIGNLVLNEHLLHQVLKTTHPTSEIFDHTQSLYERLQHDECVLRILEAIYLSEVKLDDVGDIHEYFIQDEAKSKSKMYGQFFTPNEICMKAMELVQPKLKPDGSIPDCLDPAAGSFKFMRNLAKHLSETSGKAYEDILLNHCFGCEIEKKAYRSLQFNIVMETGDLSENVYHANSLKYLMYGKDANDKRMEEVRDYDTEKRYDYIFANPPFGCKTELEMIQRNADDKVDKKTKAIGNYKMKTKNSDGMFLQLIIHLLKDGGEACIVMCGSIFNKDWINLRKHWIGTCVIKSITVCPKDSFKNTSIESYLIHFKKGGRTDRVEYHHFTDGYIGERSEFDETFDLSVPRSSIVAEPSHSTSYSIAELCEINELKADRKKYQQYKYIEISSIDENGLAQPTVVNKDELPSRAQLGVKVGDILFGSVRPNLKRHLYVDTEMFADNLIVSTGFFVLTSKQGVDGYFLYNLLFGQEFTDECMQYASKKAMYPSVNKEDLGKITIRVPSYELQVSSSQKLKTLDHNISITKQKIEADKEYMKILLETETMGCEKVRLGDVCNMSVGFTPSTKDPTNYTDGEHVWITIADLTANGDQKFISQSKQKISDIALKPSKKAKKGSVLVSFKLSVGKTAICTTDVYHNEAIASLTSKSADRLHQEYVYYAMLLGNLERDSQINIYGANIFNQESLKNVTISVPDKCKQQMLVNKLSGIQSNIQDHHLHILELQSLKQEVMKKQL
jgi:type I restriction enzyme, S subunit